MKRDDFGMRIDEVRELATKYSKQDLARMVKMGMLDPQRALMAGMMIDRIAKSAMQPPQTTVAEDVLAPQQPTTAQAGIMAAPGAPQPSPGVAGLPSGLQNMAGGGIVAFADGGDTFNLPDIDYSTGKMPIYAAKAPEQIDIAEAARRRAESERLAGFDPNMYKTMREEEMATKEDLAAQREQAKGMAALQFGLGLMGARKGQEWQTASAAGQVALGQYASAIKDIKASEKEMKKTLRELSLAENAYKKSNSEKDLARVDAAKEALRVHEENFTKAKNDGVRIGADLYKSNATIASQQLIADKNNLSAQKIAGMQINAQKAIHAMKTETERQMDRIEALRKEGKNEEADRLESTYKSLKGIDVRGGSDADKAYDNVMARLKEDFKFAKEVKDDPTALDRAIEKETQRLRTSHDSARPSTTPPPQQGAPGSGFSEGQESKDTQGRPIVYRNGQWVYK